MDLDIPHLAKLHFITEHTARHARLQEGQEPAPWPCPNFENQWQVVDKVQRDRYIQRAQQLACSDLQPRPDFDYEGILTLVYKKCYADMEQGEAAIISSIGQDNFRDHLRELSAADWAAFHKFTFVGDEEDDYGTDLEDAMPDVEEEPLDYDPRGEEDPQIAMFEKAVEAGMATLKRLRHELKRSRVNMDDTDWISEIDRLESYSKPGQVVIGVVGSTGVGKSSLINALVDEERILATDCMRASTAVATEIVYNNGGSQYKAEIQFVNRSEWEKELQALVWDLDEDNTGEIREDIANDSEAGAALAKIKAVYPWLETRYIMDTPVQTLLDHPSVSSLLGSEKFVEENKPQAFYRRVKTYLDSEGKGRGRHKKFQPYNSVSVWPLVRVVRIFVPAPALSTGAVMVDLPGLFDSNPARVAVAEQYMKRCSAHWIVAPINRAASDKVAKDLLGKNFKMHMQMKNAFSSITFICTKTDDISISETQDSLNLDLPVPEQREAKLAQLKAELKELHDKREQIMDDVANVDEEIEETEAQTDSAEHPPDASISIPTKRKKQDGTTLNTEAGSEETPLDATATDNHPDVDESKTPVTDQLTEKLQDLKSQRKKLVAQRRPLGQEIKCKETEIEEFETASRNMKLDVYQTCIQERNEYSKREIKRDFARGIQDLDEELDEELDETTDQGTKHRMTQDYQKLERDLPVFCVSARAYQKLRGRMRKEATVEGFEDFEETGILRLQRHCITLTEEARRKYARRFLTHLQRLLRSMSVWTSSTDSTTVHVSASKRSEIEADFQNTRRAFHYVCDPFLFYTVIFQDVVHKLNQASVTVCEAFSRTVSEWHASRDKGGGHWQTYRATCSRDGMFGKINWNGDLAYHLWKAIHHKWVDTFAYFIKWEFKDLAQVLQKGLTDFHLAAIRSAKHELPTDHMNMLSEALRNHSQTLEVELEAIEDNFKAAQREISYVFPATIREELASTYKACAMEKGRGTFNRMKYTMAQKVADSANHIVHECTERVRKTLDELERDTEDNLEGIMTMIMNSMKNDYYIALIEPQIRQFTAKQIGVRRQLDGIVREMISSLQLGQLLNQK